MPKRIDLTGQRIFRLTVLPNPTLKDRKLTYKCLCDCGKTVKVLANHLHMRRQKSCGCYRTENSRRMLTTHGLTGTPGYWSWVNMRQRCNNPKHPRYKDYGGRGISICKRWSKFEAFIKDMGPKPPGLSIDRINNSGNYTPSNCRWSTPEEQRSNKRRC